MRLRQVPVQGLWVRLLCSFMHGWVWRLTRGAPPAGWVDRPPSAGECRHHCAPHSVRPPAAPLWSQLRHELHVDGQRLLLGLLPGKKAWLHLSTCRHNVRPPARLTRACAAICVPLRRLSSRITLNSTHVPACPLPADPAVRLPWLPHALRRPQLGPAALLEAARGECTRRSGLPGLPHPLCLGCAAAGLQAFITTPWLGPELGVHARS